MMFCTVLSRETCILELQKTELDIVHASNGLKNSFYATKKLSSTFG